MKKVTLFLLFFILSINNFAQKGEVDPSKLPALTLSGKDGGRLDGKDWSTAEIKGKVTSLFYVDPDEADMNKAATEALNTESFDNDKFQSIAIVNMAAAPWKPNAVIEYMLKGKQKKFPRALFLKDFNKVLMNKWQLKDHSSNVLIFNKNEELIFKVMGKLSADHIIEMISIIKKNL